MLSAGAPRALAPSEVESDGGGAPALGFALQVRHLWAAHITHQRTPPLSPVPYRRACGRVL